MGSVVRPAHGTGRGGGSNRQGRAVEGTLPPAAPATRELRTPAPREQARGSQPLRQSLYHASSF
eukprot:1456661-Lingulodinium_polyedra.AAC.1